MGFLCPSNSKEVSSFSHSVIVFQHLKPVPYCHRIPENPEYLPHIPPAAKINSVFKLNWRVLYMKPPVTRKHQKLQIIRIFFHKHFWHRMLKHLHAEELHPNLRV